MAWLFAVALDLHRGGRHMVLVALLPIGLGHALAVLHAVLARSRAPMLLTLPSAQDQCRRRGPQPSEDSRLRRTAWTWGYVDPWSIQVRELVHQ